MKKKILIFILILAIAFIGTVFFNQKSIMHPTKRLLEAYHYEWLNHPEQHSMKIIKMEEHPEILIVEFDPMVKLSERAKKIEKELFNIGYKASDLKNNGIIIFFHGKNGRKEDLLPVVERYIAVGFTAVLVDLPLHGESQKIKLTYGQGEDTSLYEEVLSVVEDKIAIANRPLYFWGISLGGAYAISSALPEKRIFQAPKALVLVSTFDKLSYVLKEKSTNLFGDYLGKLLYQTLNFSLKTFYHFNPEKSDSATNAEKIKIPIFILHGKKDKLIGYRHGEALFNRFATQNKEFHLDENGDHHNILITNYPFYLKSIDFLLKSKEKKF